VDVLISGVRHRLYVETDAVLIQNIRAAMRGKPMFIADGHHRFEVACRFKQFARNGAAALPDGSLASDYVLSYFSDCKHNPYKIYPTHRLVSVPASVDPLSVLKRRGILEKVPGLPAILSRLLKSREEFHGEGYEFGVYTRKGGFFIFKLDPRRTAGLRQDPVKRLDVSVLHNEILKPCFGISKIEKSKKIDFTRDAGEACARVRRGDFQAAFFLRPTSLGEMLLVSKKGLKMPQKSTYFYPKLLTGLVFHDLGGA
jgi:uncharacterized protein (DUF1015 family)